MPTLTIRGGDVTACLRACYASFREHLRRTEDGLTCSCDACSSGARLDLKFILHHGSYVAQTIAGRTELLGPDVTTAHRMLKTMSWRQRAAGVRSHLGGCGPAPGGVGRRRCHADRLAYHHVGRMSALVLPLDMNE